MDDKPDLICVLQVQLKNKGYDTVQAANGMQAVDIATAQLPDLVVMDTMMPQMNGLQAARLIRENPKTPFVSNSSFDGKDLLCRYGRVSRKWV